MGVLAWYFVAPRKATHAQVQGGRQVIDITVKGGYSPSLIRVQAGTPIQLRFHRQENSDCTARVVSRPAHERLAGRLRHDDAGSRHRPTR